MINIDARLEDADWPKRTPDKMSDLGAPTTLEFNRDQARDELGRWTDEGGSGGNIDPVSESMGPNPVGFPKDDEVRTSTMDPTGKTGESIDKLDRYNETIYDRGEITKELDHYTGEAGGFQSVNQLLHRNKNADKAPNGDPQSWSLDRRTAVLVNEAIKDGPDIDMIVWRGARLSDQSLEKMSQVGQVVRFAGITSTSTDPGRALRFETGAPMLEIRAKLGMWGNQAEAELMLPHGARYIVRGVKEVDIKSDRDGSIWEKSGRYKIIQLEQL